MSSDCHIWKLISTTSLFSTCSHNIFFYSLCYSWYFNMSCVHIVTCNSYNICLFRLSHLLVSHITSICFCFVFIILQCILITFSCWKYSKNLYFINHHVPCWCQYYQLKHSQVLDQACVLVLIVSCKQVIQLFNLSFLYQVGQLLISFKFYFISCLHLFSPITFFLTQAQ